MSGCMAMQCMHWPGDCGSGREVQFLACSSCPALVLHEPGGLLAAVHSLTFLQGWVSCM